MFQNIRYIIYAFTLIKEKSANFTLLLNTLVSTLELIILGFQTLEVTNKILDSNIGRRALNEMVVHILVRT